MKIKLLEFIKLLNLNLNKEFLMNTSPNFTNFSDWYYGNHNNFGNKVVDKTSNMMDSLASYQGQMYKSPEQQALESRANSQIPMIKEGLLSNIGFRNIPKPEEQVQEQAGSIANGKYVPPVQTSPFKDAGLPDAQIQALLHQIQPTISEQSKTNILGEQVPIQNLDSGVGYVNGKLFDSNKQSPQGMFTGYSKERDAAIDPNTGRLNKNSEFYKRNKKAMENL